MKSIGINLSKKENELLTNFIKKGERKAREFTRAHILLLANRKKKDTEIAEFLMVHRHTVWKTKKTYLEDGLRSALEDDPRPGQPKKYTVKHEAEIAALACTEAPEGRKRWTLRLLEQELKKKEGFETITRESIRLILKKRHKTVAHADVVYSGNG